MRLLLVIPPQITRSVDGVNCTATVSIPLGILHMASYLQARDWPGEISVYDARLSAAVSTCPDGTEFFGDSWEKVRERIRELAPDVVGISNMFSWQIRSALRVAEVAKEARPGVITVLGGPHASSFPDKMLREPDIDYVVMGEGEERLHLLLEALAMGQTPSIQGVLGREDDLQLLRPNKKAPIGFIKHLDDLPFPAYEMVDLERYFYLQFHGHAPRVREFGKRAVTILTSRGCPHQCIFCSVQTTMGYKFRYHSSGYVQRHIELLRHKYAIDYIHFEDDNLTYDRDRFDELLEVLLSLSPRIPWDTPNGVRADSWTFERIARTKESGCEQLCIALESSVQRVIDEVVKKKLDLSEVEPVMRACKEVGLSLSAFYVLGLPGETAKEIRTNIDYAIDKYVRYDVYPTFSMANPLPGTELHDIVVRDNLLHGATLTEPPRANTIKTDEFDPTTLQALYDLASRKKTLVTVRKMATSPAKLRYFLGLALRNKWFFKNILRATWRSLLRPLQRPWEAPLMAQKANIDPPPTGPAHGSKRDEGVRAESPPDW